MKHRPERDRAVFTVLRAIRGAKNGDVAKRSGVAAQTIANWRKPVEQGGTRYPQFWTLNQVARAFGKQFVLVDMNEPARPHREDRPRA